MPAMLSDAYSHLPPSHRRWRDGRECSVLVLGRTPCCNSKWVEYRDDRAEFGPGHRRCGQCKLVEGARRST